MLPRACMGIVTLYFLRYQGTDAHAFERDLAARFPCCIKPLEDLRGAFLFWGELRRCVDEIAEPLGAEELAEDMKVASEILSTKRQQLGLVPRGDRAGGGGPQQHQLQQQFHQHHGGGGPGGGGSGKGGAGGGGGGKGHFHGGRRNS
mmetsp:Transcript_39946/g.105261  ORF Transcript_39946/g.105261 Transcript_39946/m.105261 type:complete len:147 (+) Transcript_39946:2-442(+)